MSLRSRTFPVTPLILVLLQLNSVSAIPTPSIWDIHIENGPSPPPDKGAPLSASAQRDPSQLKYELIGIGAAYLFWLSVTLVLIVLVGSRLRRRTQSSNSTLSMEMVKPALVSVQHGTAIDPPLKSPGKMASLKSWASGGKTHSHKLSNVSSSTIDERVVEQDRARNLDEMARLYAAVIAHDEEKSQKSRESGLPTPVSPRSPRSPRSPQYPPEFQHLRVASQSSVGDQITAQTLSHPLAPTPAYDDDLHSQNTSRASSKIKASPVSFVSSGKPRMNNRPLPSRISVRGQPISKPIGSPDLTNADMYGEDVPLSPRLYNPGPPPPAPGQDSMNRYSPPTTYAEGTVASNSNASLPFRQMYQDPARSAPATKTTFVDRSNKNVTGPRTGVPRTPYSPYTPFTPMTPITPRRLVTKEDRKKEKKKEGMKVLSEDDMVMSDEDMWGSVA